MSRDDGGAMFGIGVVPGRLIYYYFKRPSSIAEGKYGSTGSMTFDCH
jgi:hypothetical protein